MKSVAIYVRVSTSLQDTVSQRDAIERWLRALPEDQRPKKVRYFEDQGRSGADDDRPGFLSIMAAARAREIDTVICFSLDRMSRTATTALRCILDLDALGVGFIATSQPILNLGHTNPFRRTMLAAFAEIAEIERTIIISRIRAGLDAARAKGVRLGKAPLAEKKKREIIDLFHSGLSKNAICEVAEVGRATVSRVLKKYEASQHAAWSAETQADVDARIKN